MPYKKSISAEKESTKYAKDIINWSALSEKLANNRDSIRSNRIPNKYKPTIDTLIKFIEWWVEGKEPVSPEHLKQKIQELDLFSILMGENGL